MTYQSDLVPTWTAIIKLWLISLISCLQVQQSLNYDLPVWSRAYRYSKSLNYDLPVWSRAYRYSKSLNYDLPVWSRAYRYSKSWLTCLIWCLTCVLAVLAKVESLARPATQAANRSFVYARSVTCSRLLTLAC